MKIYTKKGDDGTTGLFYGGRVPKDDLAPEAYGSVDEAVSALGVVRAGLAEHDPLNATILERQRELFVVAAELATDPENAGKLEDGVSRVTEAMVTHLEAAIDDIVDNVGMPTEFVVPGGTEAAAGLDLARTIVRRAERRAVAVMRSSEGHLSYTVPYLNRLADYLYMLARAVEGEWTPSRKERP